MSALRRDRGGRIRPVCRPDQQVGCAPHPLSATIEASAQPQLGSFLGLWMLEDDLPAARWLFGTLLLVALVLAGLLGRQFWQRRRGEGSYVLSEAS